MFQSYGRCPVSVCSSKVKFADVWSDFEAVAFCTARKEDNSLGIQVHYHVINETACNGLYFSATYGSLFE